VFGLPVVSCRRKGKTARRVNRAPAAIAVGDYNGQARQNKHYQRNGTEARQMVSG